MARRSGRDKVGVSFARTLRVSVERLTFELPLCPLSRPGRSLLRLLLLLLTCRPLLHPLLPTTSLDPAQFAPSPPSTPPSPSSRPKDPLKEILLPKTLYANSLTAPRDLVGRLSSRGMVGEALYAMRGLLYVLMLKSRSTSLPVLLSLLIALVSRTLLRAERKRDRQGRGVVGGLEKEEFVRRDRALGGLLFRGVLWEGLTKCVLFAFLSHS